MEYYWSLTATIVIAMVGWGWAIFQHRSAQKQREPLIVFEMVRDARRQQRCHGSITVRNRGPADLYVIAVELVQPAREMCIDTGGPVFFFEENSEARPKKCAREIVLNARLKPYTGATEDFPSGDFSFWIDDVPEDCSRFSILVRIAPALDSRDCTSFRRSFSIHNPKR